MASEFWAIGSETKIALFERVVKAMSWVRLVGSRTFPGRPHWGFLISFVR